MNVKEVEINVRRVYSVAEYETVTFECRIVDQPEPGGDAEDTAHALFGVAIHAIRDAVAAVPIVVESIRRRQAAVAVTHKIGGKIIEEES